VFDLPTVLFVTTEIEGSSVVGSSAPAGGTTDSSDSCRQGAFTGCVDAASPRHRFR
jgi:hypothetical protein